MDSVVETMGVAGWPIVDVNTWADVSTPAAPTAGAERMAGWLVYGLPDLAAWSEHPLRPTVPQSGR